MNKYLTVILLGVILSSQAIGQTENSKSAATRLKEEARKIRQVSVKKYAELIDKTLYLLKPEDKKVSESGQEI